MQVGSEAGGGSAQVDDDTGVHAAVRVGEIRRPTRGEDVEGNA